MPTAKREPLTPALLAAAAVAATWAAGYFGLAWLVRGGLLPAHLMPVLAWGLVGLLALVAAAGWAVGVLLARHRAAVDAAAARSRLIVDAAADAILTLDYQGRIESFNAAAARMFGYEASEVLGRDFSLLIGTADKSGLERLLQETVPTGSAKVLVDSTTFVGKHKGGHTFPVELGVSKVIDEDRRVYVQIVRDLTERKRAERHRRIQYETARVLAGNTDLAEAGPRVLEVIGSGVGWPAGLLWKVDPSDGLLRCVAAWAEGGPALRFTSEARAATHAPGSGLPGRVWLRHELRWLGKLAADPDLPTAAARRAGYESAIAWPVELEKQTLGVLEFYAPEITDPDDDLKGCLYPVATHLAQFIRRKADEEALKKALVAAEAASQAKSEFLANISHEIRTPLNGIVGLTEIALMGELEAQQREHLGLVQSSANTLLALVNDLLDFAKIEAARMDLECVPFAVRAGLEPTLRALGVRARQKGLAFTHTFDPDVPVWVVGDPLRLQQVLFNLVGNAIKFTHKGEVTVRLGLAARTARDVILHGTVRDTGIGIAHEKQEAIFEAFSQADGSRARKFGGTGLGLTIASRLVGLMGGRVWVESQPGKGSTFHFTACLAATSEATLGEPEGGTGAGDDSVWGLSLTQAADPCGKRILVAEDNPVNRVLLDLILQKRQHQVTFACNGVDAVRLWQEQPFDLVLMDVQLPEMDGVEATMLILEESRRTGRPAMIVGLTAHASTEDRQRCLGAGMAAYIAKPIQPRDLLDAIDRLVRPPSAH